MALSRRYALGLLTGVAAAGIGNRVIPVSAQNADRAWHVGIRRSRFTPPDFPHFQLRQSKSAKGRRILGRFGPKRE